MSIDPEQLVDSIGMIIILLGYGFKKIRDWVRTTKTKKKSKIEDTVKNLDSLYEKIIECRLQFDACRVSINQFHNGDYFYSNNSILKMSMTHETTDDSTRKINDHYQNILVSKYYKFINNLVSKDIVVYNDIEDSNSNDDEMVLDLKINGTTDFYAMKLRNNNGHVIGFLTMSFCDKPKEEVDLDDFREYGEIVSFILRH